MCALMTHWCKLVTVKGANLLVTHLVGDGDGGDELHGNPHAAVLVVRLERGQEVVQSKQRDQNA